MSIANKHTKDWMKLLDPEEVKYQLISSSFYVTAYDILIETIVQKIKDLHFFGVDEYGMILDPEYKIQVRKLFKKDIVIASLLWLKNHDAISEHELERVKVFKEHRNELAHELSEMIGDSDKRTKIEFLIEMRNLRYKLLKWWFINFEMEINPSLSKLDAKDLNFDEILGPSMFVMNHLINILQDEVEKRVIVAEKKNNNEGFSANK